jgi:HTH-type transcriptional regulator, sugar sensing transcriptional regulator
MIEQKVLQNLGLNEKEALIYLALLELGKSTVVQIAKKAEIKRPTAYLVLDSLKQKGLVSEVPEKSRTLYAAENPESLEQNVKHSLSDFHELLPVLKASYSRGTKPTIRYYDDKDTIENLYYNEIFPSQRIFFYGTSIKKIMQVWPKMFAAWEAYWWPKKKKHPHNVLELVSNEPEDIAYAKQCIGKREVRIIPKSKKFFADSGIADEKIIITSLDPVFAVIIESPQLADTYRALVELAWEAAIPAQDWKD